MMAEQAEKDFRAMQLYSYPPENISLMLVFMKAISIILLSIYYVFSIMLDF